MSEEMKFLGINHNQLTQEEIQELNREKFENDIDYEESREQTDTEECSWMFGV
jgi:hypothetical protein